MAKAAKGVARVARPPWRPTKLTPEVEHRILEAVVAGNTLSTAAEYAGVYRETLRVWMDKGEVEANADQDTEFSRLFRALRQKLAEAVTRNVALIQRAAQDGTWTASAWWLERRYPDEWGKPPERVEVSVPRPIRFLFQLPDGTERPIIVGGSPPSALPPRVAGEGE